MSSIFPIIAALSKFANSCSLFFLPAQLIDPLQEHFTEVLPRLKSLNQLCLQPPSWRIFKGRGCFPTEPHWPGVTGERELALRYAAAIHQLCPSVRYIKIDFWAYRVHGEGLVPLTEADLHFNDLFNADRRYVGCLDSDRWPDWTLNENYEERIRL